MMFKNKKKILYVTCFTLLGYLLGQIIHGLIEIWYIGLLTADFSRFGFGLSWDMWALIQYIQAGILFLAGILLGFWQGKHWWSRLYDEEGRRKLFIRR